MVEVSAHFRIFPNWDCDTDYLPDKIMSFSGKHQAKKKLLLLNINMGGEIEMLKKTHNQIQNSINIFLVLWEILIAWK